MSLLSVTVKKAQLSGAQGTAHQWNSYVTLKLQHVKSTTVTVKGPNPSWEQDFLFEVNNLDAGLLIEVWSKGVIWDKAVGYHWLHLRDIQHSNVEGTGQWLTLEAELVMREGEVVGTKTPTGHAILIDARFELPYASDVECDDAVELQRKLVMFNSMLDQNRARGADQSRRQHQYYVQSGVSEDSDYTSDINYPIGQNPNSSASQYLTAANQLTTPQRSLNSSRENSYEDDYYHHRTNGSGSQHPSSSYYPSYPPPHHQPQGRKQLPAIPTQGGKARTSATAVPPPLREVGEGYWDDPAGREPETDPLYYNSRPQSNYKSRYRRRGSWEDDYDQKRPENTTRQQYNDEYDEAQQYSQPSHNYSKRLKSSRVTPTMERQYSLYEGGGGGTTRDYLGDEEITDVTSKSIPYVNDTYTSYNQQNAHDTSVYNDYNQDYSDYPNEPVYEDDGRGQGYISEYDTYNKDTSYVDEAWTEENDIRDQYSTTKPSKELPSLPSQYNRKSQLPAESLSPFNSQSTVKEMSIAPPPPSITVQQQSQKPTSTNFTSINPSGYGNLEEDASFYETSNYNKHHQMDHITSSSLRGGDATVPTITTTTASTDQTEQYVDAYENQAAYEDWQNYGYYDEYGNYVSYDQSSYYQDETASGNLISDEKHQILPEKDAYSYYDHQTDHLPPSTTSTSTYDQINTTASVASAPTVPATVTTTTTKVSVHQEPVLPYDEQYEDPNYYTSGTVQPQQSEQYQQPYDDQTVVQDSYGSYDQDGYWYDASEETQGYLDPIAKTTVPIPTSTTVTDPYSQPTDEKDFNYAYQDPEDFSSFDNHQHVHPKLDKSESISRRSSFRRQTSTRGDHYGSAFESDMIPPVTTTTTGTTSLPTTSYQEANHISYSSKPMGQDVQTTTTTTPSIGLSSLFGTKPVTTTATVGSTPGTTASSTGSAAAAAANKLTSGLTSALPQLSSLTKGKTDLFSSSFSKFGSFMSNAAAKTGVSVPLINKDQVPPKPKEDGMGLLSHPQTSVTDPHLQPPTQGQLNQGQLDQGYSFDETQEYAYDEWNGQYEDPYHEGQGDYGDYGVGEVRPEGQEYTTEASKTNGLVHKDSVESNASDGQNAEDLEAEYWLQQQIRINQVNNLQTQESVDYNNYPYDSYGRGSKPGVLQSMDSVDEAKPFGHDDLRQNSLDKDEWLRRLDEQSASTSSRPPLNKKDTMSMSLDERSESIDQGTDYGDDYDDERIRQESLESGEGAFPPSPPPLHSNQILEEDETMVEDEQQVTRKSSLDIALKEKGGKTVSFEEEATKAAPERQTKGMTPREKWIWVVNRIYSNSQDPFHLMPIKTFSKSGKGLPTVERAKRLSKLIQQRQHKQLQFSLNIPLVRKSRQLNISDLLLLLLLRLSSFFKLFRFSNHTHSGKLTASLLN